MQVILRADVSSLGKRGDICDVADTTPARVQAALTTRKC